MLKKTDLGMNLCGVADVPENAEAVKAVGAACKQIELSINSMLDYLEEPLKGQFLKIKNDINVTLAKLPLTDQVPAAAESNSVLRQLLSVLSYAQDMMKTLAAANSDLNGKLATTRASLSGEVATAITAKVAAGELISKADHDAAVLAAGTAARAQAVGELKVIADRKTALTTAGLPSPADDVLAGQEADFNAKRDAAKLRADALKPFSLGQDRLTTLCWGPSDQYDTCLGLLKEATAVATAKTQAAKPQGFLTPTAGAADNSAKRKLGVL